MGLFGSNLKTTHYQETGVRVVRLQNIGVGAFIDDDKAYVSPDHFSTLAKHRCLPGDVLIGTLGDPNLRACVLPSSVPEALNKADCVQFRVNPERATAAWACGILNLPQTLSMAAQMIQGITRARISMGRLRELVIPVPPLGLQHKFAAAVESMNAISTSHSVAAIAGTNLFQSLLHRAFDGAL